MERLGFKLALRCGMLVSQAAAKPAEPHLPQQAWCLEGPSSEEVTVLGAVWPKHCAGALTSSDSLGA